MTNQFTLRGMAAIGLLLISFTTYLAQESFYSIDTEWIYSEQDTVDGEIQVSPKSIQIIAAGHSNGIFFADLSDRARISIEESKVYEGEYLVYDFAEEVSYDFKYYNFEKEIVDSCTAIIDSLTTEILFGGDAIRVQNISVSCAERDPYKMKVYNKVGVIDYPFILYDRANYKGIEELGQNKLRCFVSEIETYNFEDFGCDSTWVITSTEDLLSESHIDIYPNPTDLTLKVRLDMDQPLDIIIYDVFGHVILKNLIDKNQSQISFDVSNYSAGNYFIQTIGKEGRISTKKFTVK